MNFVQENNQNHDDRTCGADATKPDSEPKMLSCFQQNLTPEQFDQVIAASQCIGADATKPEPKMLACFQQNLTPEQFDQVIAASNDEDDPPALFSIHMETFQQFVNAVIAYAGPVPPPVGLIIPAVVTPETLMIAILDYLRGVGTPRPSPPPIGVVCLPCSQVELVNVCVRAERLESSQWVAALVASVPPGVAIAPIASMWTTIPRRTDGQLQSLVTIPLSPIALWN